MAGLGLILATLGGAGVIIARLLVLKRRGTLVWEREIGVIVAFPFVILVLVVVARRDEPLARAEPILTGSLSAVVLGSLGAYALWLGARYDSASQRVLGRVSLGLAGVALLMTVVAAALR